MDRDYGLKIRMHLYQIVMKENLLMIRNVDKEHINGLKGINILVIFLMMFDMDMVKCNGMMGKFIEVCGKRVCNGVKVNYIKVVRLRIKVLLKRIN